MRAQSGGENLRENIYVFDTGRQRCGPGGGVKTKIFHPGILNCLLWKEKHHFNCREFPVLTSNSYSLMSHLKTASLLIISSWYLFEAEQPAN